nr:immunoglobulin heavy chain junction region [Macaca mulatta]MOY23781.1 immunoglobulin heavy chain junction region [Macaca mulatta]MOY25373.1 immunoglobulin heavy chain junction region [Macaca mulatta]
CAREGMGTATGPLKKGVDSW